MLEGRTYYESEVEKEADEKTEKET